MPWIVARDVARRESGLARRRGAARGGPGAVGAAALLLVLAACAARPAAAEDLDASWSALLADAAAPLATPADLDQLLERIGAARVVLLGEASHGTQEYYTWRAAITRRLVEEKGFDFVAVEGDWPACARVNAFVKGLPGAAPSARQALGGFNRWPTWMWANAPIEALVGWLANVNADRPAAERVGFYGLDLYDDAGSIEAVVAYLEDVSPEAAELARGAYACLRRFDGDPGAYVRWTQEAGRSCQEQVEAVVALLAAREPDVAARGRKAWFAAHQSALAVKRAERHYRAMSQRGAASWNHRARHMQATLERMLERHGPDSRAVVWAHNTHVGDARATEMARQGMENMGQLSRERFGREEVFALGFASHRGELVAGRSWGAPAEVMTLPPAPRGSFEELFHRLGLREALVLFGPEPAAGALLEPLGHRAAGVVYQPEHERAGNYVGTVLPRRYDALIYLDETRALQPLR